MIPGVRQRFCLWSHFNMRKKQLCGVRLVCALGALLASPAASGQEMVFPAHEWEQASPPSQGVNPDQLKLATEYRKQQADQDGIQRLVIVRRGRMIARRRR
jgi:hypothetical protein